MDIGFVQSHQFRQPLADKAVFVAEQWNENQVLIGTRDAGFFLLGPNGMQPFQMPASKELDQAMIYTSQRLRNGLLAIGTVRDGIYLLDQQGNIHSHINKFSGMLDDNIRALMDTGLAGVRFEQPWILQLQPEGPATAAPDRVEKQIACGYETFFVCERYIGTILKRLGFSHMSARPRHPKQNGEIVEAFKKTSRAP